MIAVGGELLVGLALVIAGICWTVLRVLERRDEARISRLDDQWLARQRRQR